MRLARRQTKSIPLLYGGLAGLLLTVIAAMALVLVPPSPPQVAEFAPQAQEQIEDSLENQSSQFGTGAGTCALGQLCEGADAQRSSSLRRIVEKARVRRCVGEPPRQTEDPQSPPCVNYWEGDNGGATSKGVTRDEIRVGLDNFWGNAGTTAHPALIEHFNRRYEFYGRKLRTFFVTVNNSSDPAAQRAAAQQAAKDFDIFAMAGTFGRDGGDGRPFGDELARLRVIHIDEFGTWLTQGDLEAHSPYQWTYGPTLDLALKNTVEWGCHLLVGKAPRYAPSMSLSSRRSFAVLRREDAGGAPDLSILTNGLSRCGATLKVYALPQPVSDPLANVTNYRTLMATVQQDGHTTLICVCRWGEVAGAQSAAQDNNYDPEWVNPGLTKLSGDDSGYAPGYRGENFFFGIGAANKPLPLGATPWAQAVKEVNPSATFGGTASGSRTIGDDSPPLARAYHALLLLASGIQGAGPNLTPERFERALFETRFSNPGSGAAPNWQSHVGFGFGDRSMVDDFAQIYRDQNANVGGEPPFDRAGWCYLGRGTRWSLGHWPTTDQPFFDRTLPCR